MARIRFRQLNGEAVDLLLFGDTHPIGIEIREVRSAFFIELFPEHVLYTINLVVLHCFPSKRTTGDGFTLSSPYYYDGMAYFGNETLVECAENKRFTLNAHPYSYALLEVYPTDISAPLLHISILRPAQVPVGH